MNFCVWCGASIDLGEKFCWNLGFRQPDDEPSRQSPARPPPQLPAPVGTGIVLTPKIITVIIVASSSSSRDLFSCIIIIHGYSCPRVTVCRRGQQVRSPSGADRDFEPAGSFSDATTSETTMMSAAAATPGCPQGFVLCSGLCRR